MRLLATTDEGLLLWLLTLSACLLVVRTAQNFGNYEKDYSPLLDQHSAESNPGIFLRLMPTGLAYLREIGMKVVNEQILRIELPRLTEHVDAGQVSIWDARISKYWAPAEYSLELAPPSSFQWTMSKMHIRAAGEFTAQLATPLLLPTVPITGHFEALLGHVALSMTVKLLRSDSGAPLVQTTFCQATVGYVDLSVRNTGVLTDFFINSFKAFLIGHFKPMVEQRMCAMTQNIVNDDMNALLSTMPLKVKISENNLDVIGAAFGLQDEKQRGESPSSSPSQAITFPATPPTTAEERLSALKNLTLLNFVSNLRKKPLELDYRLTADPFVNDGAIAVMARGEISWHGLGGTPFHPPTVRIPAPHGVHMVEFFGTDFIANSMLLHAYRQHLLDMVIGPESAPQLKELLKTSCGEAGYCLGEFLGALGEQFPHRDVEIRFSAKKAPILVFVKDRCRFRLHGIMNMFVRPANSSQTKQMVLRSETSMTANVLMWMDGPKVVGNATIDNLDFRLTESKIDDVDQNVFADLGLFGAEFLQTLLTDILQVGITIPTMTGVVLKNPKLTFHERYMKMSAYFKLDEAYAATLVRGAVKQSLAAVG